MPGTLKRAVARSPDVSRCRLGLRLPTPGGLAFIGGEKACGKAMLACGRSDWMLEPGSADGFAVRPSGCYSTYKMTMTHVHTMASRFLSQRVLRVAAFVSLAIIVGMSIVPGSSRPTVEVAGLLIGALGVIEHILGYAVCGGLFVLGFAHWRTSLVFLALAGLAFGLETVQMVVPERTAKVSDAVLSAAGAALGICVALWLRRYWMKLADRSTGR